MALKLSWACSDCNVDCSQWDEWKLDMQRRFGPLLLQTFTECGIDFPVHIRVTRDRYPTNYQAKAERRVWNDGKSSNILTIDARLLEDFPEDALKALIAHEAKHFLRSPKMALKPWTPWLQLDRSYLEEARCDRFAYKLYGEGALTMRREINASFALHRPDHISQERWDAVYQKEQLLLQLLERYIAHSSGSR